MAGEKLVGALPTGWEYTTLGEVCARGGGGVQTGPFGSQLHAADYVPHGIPSIMPQNIGDNRVVRDGIARITVEDAKRLNRYLVRPGDIVYSRRGDVERRALIRGAEDGWLCGTGCLRVRFGEGYIDSTFASYYLGDARVREWVVRHAHGATMPNLNTGILSALPFVMPPLEKQHAIGHILGTLDDKIELNRQMSETLEAMARALFKSWFIDFDPVRRNAVRSRNQPSPRPSPSGRGHQDYRAGYDFAGLVEAARTMRKKQTPAEIIFWELVRDRQFMGLKFRRQHQVGDYIADFYCHEHRLVIELDGGIHSEKRKKDHKRDAWMKVQDLTVLRFSNGMLFDDPGSVLAAIYDVVFPSTSGRGAGGEGVVAGETYDHLFPDSFEDSELGEIPKGWEVKRLGDLLELAYGKALKAEVRRDGNVPVFGSNGQVGWHDERLVEGPGIVVGRKGNPGVVTWASTDFFAIDTSFYVVPAMNCHSLHFLFHALKNHDLASLGADSAVPGLNRNMAYMSTQVLPSGPLLDKFDSYVSAIALRVNANDEESRTLATLRDTLLPKLISGELRVKDAERTIERTI